MQPRDILARPSPWLLRVLSVAVALLIPVLLVLVGVRLVMTEAYLTLEYNKPDFPPDPFGFTLADRLHYAPYAVQYLTGNGGIEYLGNLTFPGGQKLFNPRELDHMIDVKNVTRIAFAVLGIAIILLALMAAGLSITPEGRHALRQGLFGGGLLMFAILAVVLLGIVANWDAFFTGFHEIFFTGNSWIFDYSDTLIRLFPVRFWQDAAITIGGLSALGAVLVLVGAWGWARHALRHTV